MNINNCLDRPEDKLDIRQYILATVQGEEDKTPDEFMDLMKDMSPVVRQNYGSCTSQAVDAIKEFQEQQILSQQFLYVMSKKISGNYNQQGEYIVSPLKAACNYGVCEEKLMPDTRGESWDEYVRKEPSKEAYDNALKYKGKRYWWVHNGINNFKNAIYQNKVPVVFAMKWYESYRNTPKSGILLAPDHLVGYHAVCGVGWDKDGLWVKNSFGESWGNNGYFKILFDKWDVVQPYAAYVLLDLPNNNKKMKIVIDKNDDQYLVEETCKFGVSIANPDILNEIVGHFAKLGIVLERPELTDMTPYFVIHGATARELKEFFNL